MPLSRPSSPMLATQTDPARPPKASALSWLMTTVLEGFAAYAEAMHPVCYDLSEHPDRRGQGEDTDFREREDVARSPTRQTASRGRSTSSTSRLATLWSRMRERKPTMMELDILDERMLQDIGLHGRPIAAIRSNDDPCE